MHRVGVHEALNQTLACVEGVNTGALGLRGIDRSLCMVRMHRGGFGNLSPSRPAEKEKCQIIPHRAHRR